MSVDEDFDREVDIYRYEPIRPYQIRLLLLHGHNGDPDSPLVCSLFAADLLDPAFDGVGLRAVNPKDDRMVSFDALSYTWGDEKVSRNITCNGKLMFVTDNLFNALYALRHAKNKDGYIWIDAVCINQSNNKEKAVQVQNMFLIYGKAARVVAWIGQAHEHTSSVLSFAGPKDIWEFVNPCPWLEDFYMRPWFRRLWVQQEVFAARSLVFQCGPYQFSWFPLLSRPEVFWEHQQTNGFHDLDHKSSEDLEELTSIPEQVRGYLKDKKHIMRLHDQRLGCFEQFHKCGGAKTDFVETILRTSVLEAKDSRDYIYAILGITGMPAKPMSIDQWMRARQSSAEAFIPIDYAADQIHLLTAVSWVVLMTEGFASLSPIIPQTRNDSTSKQLPSWVVDWQLAAAHLLLQDTSPQRAYLTQNRMAESAVPFTHKRFCYDNRTMTLPYNKVIVRGIIDSHYFVENSYVCRKRALQRNKRLWRLKDDIFPTDVVVMVYSFHEYTYERGSGVKVSIPGPWVLRPVGENEFKMLAFLAVPGLDWHHTTEPSQWKLEASAADWVATRESLQDLTFDLTSPRFSPMLADSRIFIIV